MIAQELQASIESSGWIRELFEVGGRLIAQHGAENVFDLSIGNPTFEPPREFHEALESLLHSGAKGLHRYTPNAGLMSTRAYLAGVLSSETGMEFQPEDILVTTGAAGGLNVIFKTLCDPGSEVIFFAPFFPEYIPYLKNHGGVPVVVQTTRDFRIDFEALEKAFTSRTKAVLINSPNNPTGVVYSREEIKRLSVMIRKQAEKFGTTIYLCADEPYKAITFDGLVVPSPFEFHDDVLTVTSFSKDLAIPGERIGFIAVSPRAKCRNLLRDGLVIALRTLGFVNAPAIMQRMLPLVGKARVDITPYQVNRDLLYNHLVGLGVKCQKPQGAFYLFPESPIPDDKALVKKALEHKMILVPGSGLGRPGYFRICFCFETDLIKRSLPVFTKVLSA